MKVSISLMFGRHVQDQIIAIRVGASTHTNNETQPLVIEVSLPRQEM
jgi:hypothetical protein